MNIIIVHHEPFCEISFKLSSHEGFWEGGYNIILHSLPTSLLKHSFNTFSELFYLSDLM